MSKMYICPHCGKPGITWLRRAYLGPAIAATCRSCGKKIGVPWGRSLVAFLPFFVVSVVAPLLPGLPLQLLVWVIGAGAMFALFYRWVPLVKA